MPESAQMALSMILAARGRRQLASASDVDESGAGSESFQAEWEGMPQSGKEYQLLKQLGLLEIGGMESLDEEDVTLEPSPDTGPEDKGDESGGLGESGREGVPHYY